MTILDQMLENYNLNSLEDHKNAMKEIIQEITLAGLSKTDFFNRAAFYGGTALKLFYRIERFSEDLDFSLLTHDESFNISSYIPAIHQVAASLGLNFEIKDKEKTKDSNIKSTFIKGNTREQFLVFYPTMNQTGIAHNETIKIKFEIDIEPPGGATTELHYRLLPFPYQVRVYDKSSLFAGKLHAIIARGWKNRVKGRDLYDFLFFLASSTPVNLIHLEARLKQTKHLTNTQTLSIEMLKELLHDRFNSIDYQLAKNDVTPFIKNKESLDLWSADFFVNITRNIKVS